MANPIAQQIAQLNDQFRRGDPTVPGKTMLTMGIISLLQEHQIPLPKLAQVVTNYGDFTQHNDPYEQHDFGAFELGGTKCFWKIDYYDAEYSMGSDDPTDLTKTRRVLTILLADEW